ncbi:MAG: metalloregulator ArsR/SmtB family transcription factor [Planctomycetota bacterium]|jgi:DNA-binding transcriptional ArsR family regulator|nr:metalloregulator ArsR/SmtB family transcription factor [Planctomycetota bacterium]
MTDKLLSDESLAHAAECLKTVAHPARLRIIELMLSDRYSVGELAEACDLAPNVASEHLRLMERCGMLVSERESRHVYYRVAGPHLGSLINCIRQHFAC